MSGLGWLSALGGFAGGLAQALQQNQGQNDLGNALSALYGGSSSGSSGGGGLSPLVGMPASSGQGGQNGAYSYQGQTATNLPSAGPSMGPGPLAAQVQTAAVQPGTAQPNNGGNSPGQMGPATYSQMQQNSPQQPPGQQPGQSAQQPQPNSTTQAVQALGRGPMTLPNLIQALKQKNPNISGRHLAAAVEKALPILSMEGLQQYRGIAEQLRMQNEQSLIEDRRDRSADRKQAERDRMQMSSDRIQAQNERSQENIKVRLQSLQQAKTLKEAHESATALRSAIKDKLEATNHEIQMQYGLTDDQKATLYKQAQDDAKLASDNLDKLLAEKSKSGEAGGAQAGANNKENNAGAQAKPQASGEQKAQWKKQAQDAIAGVGRKTPADPAWVRQKYKELTGEDLGE